MTQKTFKLKVIGNTRKISDLYQLDRLVQQASSDGLRFFKTYYGQLSSNDLINFAYEFLRHAYPTIPSKLVQNILLKIKSSTFAKSRHKLYRTKRVNIPIIFDKQMINIRRDDNSWAYWIRLPILGHRHKRGCIFHNFAMEGRWPSEKLHAAESIDYIEIKRQWRKTEYVYYAHIVATFKNKQPKPTISAIGIDFNFNSVVMSDGRHVSLRAFQHNKRQLREKMSRTNGPKSLAGNTYYRNWSEDYIKKVTTRLADEFAKKALLSHVIVEDLTDIRKSSSKVYGTSKGRKFNAKLHNAFPFSMFQYHLKYKLEERGITMVSVNSAYTSQTCSVCGYRGKSSRKTQSRFECAACGTRLHADYNASVNILARGLRQLGIDAGRYSSTACEPMKPRRRQKENTMLVVV